MYSHTPIEAACHHNNNGILLLQSGKAGMAVKEFKQALAQMQRHLERVQDLPEGISFDSDDESYNMMEVSMLVDERFYVYNRAMHFILPEEDKLQKSSACFIYSSIILLNVALATHVAGLQGLEVDEGKALVQAARLYDSVISLIQSHQMQSDIAIFLLVMSINNQSLIMFDLGNCDVARKQYQALMQSSQKLHQTGYWTTLGAERIFEEFMLNAFFMKSAVTAASA